MAMLDDLRTIRWPCCRHHIREICMAFARFGLPGFESRYSEPNSAIRMLALSRVAYSLGVLCGLKTVEPSPCKSEATCA
jgi:hypothetical protein